MVSLVAAGGAGGAGRSVVVVAIPLGFLRHGVPSGLRVCCNNSRWVGVDVDVEKRLTATSLDQWLNARGYSSVFTSTGIDEYGLSAISS